MGLSRNLVGVACLGMLASSCSSGTSPAASRRSTTASSQAVSPTSQPQAPVPANPRQVLPPATIGPQSDECALTLTVEADGNVSPLLCPDGGVNVPAWQHYEKATAVLTLGRGPTASTITSAMCNTYARGFGTNPLTISAGKLAAAYYGWGAADVMTVESFRAQDDCPPSS